MSEYIAEVVQSQYGEVKIVKEKLTRCKDCKYYQQGHRLQDWLWCMMNHHYTDEEKYCAWAERKKE